MELFGRADSESDDDYARAFSGALLVAELVRILREAHTKQG